MPKIDFIKIFTLIIKRKLLKLLLIITVILVFIYIKLILLIYT